MGERTIQSIDRAIRILRLLGGARRLSVSETAARLELPVSTVHGILRTLVVHDLVVQDADSGHYQLGPTVLLLGNVYVETLELRGRSFRWADDLAATTGFAVRIAVPMGTDAIIIHHEPRHDGSRQMPETGLVLPAHASAAGKAILAWHPDILERLDHCHPLRAMTGETITDWENLTAELKDIHAVGFAREHDEAVLGESGLAAPIFDSAGRMVGAIGVVVPTVQWPLDDGAVHRVQAAARAISRELGSDQWPQPPPDLGSR